MTRVELASSAWEADALTDVLHRHKEKETLNYHVQLGNYVAKIRIELTKSCLAACFHYLVLERGMGFKPMHACRMEICRAPSTTLTSPMSTATSNHGSTMYFFYSAIVTMTSRFEASLTTPLPTALLILLPRSLRYVATASARFSERA